MEKKFCWCYNQDIQRFIKKKKSPFTMVVVGRGLLFYIRGQGKPI